MALLANVSINVESVMQTINDRAGEIVSQKANEMCSKINYELGIIMMEMNTMAVSGEDTVMFYDPYTATYRQKSHFVANIGDIVTAIVENGENQLTKRIVFKMPENMTITDEVKVCLQMATDNAKR